ncbi:endonuclease lcl3 [Penicillium taxi]|uniref:endonuclease lcl3 n=1 Tax=Penicillium taxi TaxID=168475 RepID=UPI0025451B0D|nr:endonuclease lcl3 [Penicillium taxi]KAJ5893302.1 endonuclease lcl3 [Penicillium taxi]
MAGQSKPVRLSPWGSAVAGATGAVLANAMVYPLDLVKTKLQVQVKQTKVTQGVEEEPHYESTFHAINKIIESEGVSGLYSGITGALLGVASTNFAYFYWYSIIRTLYMVTKKPTNTPGTAIELSLGAVSGAVAQLFTIPVAVITTRQQTQPKGERKGLIETGREVVDSEDGWSGLWRGLKASLILVVNPAITYGAYQRLKEVFFPGKNSLKPWEAFFLGAMSKALATIATQPLIVAKVSLQSRPPPSRQGKPFKTFSEVMKYIIDNEGVLSLFKGIGPQIVKGLLVQGLLMMTKERMELLFIVFFAYLRRIKKERLQKIVHAAASKAKSSLPPTLNSNPGPASPTNKFDLIDWTAFTETRTLVSTVILTSGILFAIRFHRQYLRRVKDAPSISASWLRRRSIFGQVTSVGDGDNFRIYHTPGGRLAGWGWLPWKKVPTNKKDLKDKTIHIRLAGVDAPEMAHFGRPEQPFAREAHIWLTSYLMNRRVRASVYRQDQYNRVVASVSVRRAWDFPPFRRRDVSFEMLRLGMATVYEAKFGSEFGGEKMEKKYRLAESRAKRWSKGLWKDCRRVGSDWETPREYKTRMASGDVTAKK